MYIHELRDWPGFRWNADRVATELAQARHRQGLLLGQMRTRGLALREEATLKTLSADVLKTSEIEGEALNADQVRSSLARRMGIDIGALAPVDRHADGVVEMMLDATQGYARLLTEERLFAWHAALFPTGRSGMTKISVGVWRDGSEDPMQVVSGPAGRARVHFEAPPARIVPSEMRAFLQWCDEDEGMDLVLKSALAHLWFVTIHPFADGNGRIARAIADMMLARSEESPQRFYSMSHQISVNRRGYYEILEETQKGDLDVTTWLLWYFARLSDAFVSAEETLSSVLAKARFWERPSHQDLNERQRAMLNRLLDGFAGKLTTTKWAQLSKCSPDTALRDIDDLVKRGVLVRGESGGRSTFYELADVVFPTGGLGG